MKRTLPSVLTSFLLIANLLISASTFAQTPILTEDQSNDIDDSAPVARVARLSFVDGDVSFLRAGVTEWAPAVENLPLLAGDQIYTGRGARAEVQLARDNYIRLSESTELTITELSDSAAQFEVTEGTAIIRIERLATTFRRFEVDTPSAAVVVQQDGLYRIDVRGEKDSELIVRRGEAEVSTEEGSLRVREGHRLRVDLSTGGRLELAIDNTRDDWDQWSYDRDTTIARTGVDLSPDYVTNYETTNNAFYGASDLSSYGTWTTYSSYGQCWIPRVASDWAPYRSGQWLWIPAAGWTWLASEPWGWAPYHYGRWAFLSGLGWAWVPGFGSSYRGYGYRDYRWRPALVYFFNSSTPRGNYIGWYPLAPGERWRRHRGNDHAHLQYPSPRDGRRRPDDGRLGSRPAQLHHGVSILPADGFARGNRSGIRPAAPGRDVSDWIHKGARAGLPEMKASPVAAAPELAENDRRRSRRLAVPAAEIIKRPVVTRNPTTDSSAQLSAHRERRTIQPRNPESFSQAPGVRERGWERRKTPAASEESKASGDSSGARSNPKVRLALPPPADKTDGDQTVRERRRNREGDPAAETPNRNPEGYSNPAKEERRRARQEQVRQDQPQAEKPQQQESNPAREERRRARQEQAQAEKQQQQESNPAKEERRRARQEQQAERPQDRGGPAPRVEPRQEKPNSESQGRHQEKQQRQERQQEQRRKP